MEKLSSILQPYKNLVGTIAGIVTMGQMFSGIFICKNIYKNKSTTDVPSTPFIFGFLIGSMMLIYAVLLQDTVMLATNISGFIINLFYLGFYYVYSSDRNLDIYRPLTVSSVFVAVIVGYILWEDEVIVVERFGLFITVFMTALMAMPLLFINDIVKKGDVSKISFPMVCMGFIITFWWLLYGIILLNNFMVIQNMVFFCLCGIQLALHWKYGNKCRVIPEEKIKTN